MSNVTLHPIAESSLIEYERGARRTLVRDLEAANEREKKAKRDAARLRARMADYFFAMSVPYGGA